MHYSFANDGTCSTRVEFDIEQGRVYRIAFHKGCDGNLKALGALAEGLRVEEAIRRLSGITCGPKGTSCGDQLARHLRETQVRSV